MTSLTLAMVLSPIANKAFELCDSDRKTIKKGQAARAPTRMKRRLRTKGPEVFVDETDSKFHFRNIKLRALQACQRLWTDIASGTPGVFACAAAFWPSAQPVRSKWVLLLENILRNIAAVKWRVLTRFSYPPWSLCDLEDPACTDETVSRQKPAQFFQHVGAFSDSPRVPARHNETFLCTDIVSSTASLPWLDLPEYQAGCPHTEQSWCKL